MAAQKRVLVYGKSLNLAGLTTCLKQVECLNVLFVDPHDPERQQCLDAFDPETIIYDLTDPPTDLDLTLMGKRPNTLLIGVDPSSDHVLVLTGKRSRAVTTEELTLLISKQTDDDETKKVIYEQGRGGAFEEEI